MHEAPVSGRLDVTNLTPASGKAISIFWTPLGCDVETIRLHFVREKFEILRS